MCYLNRKSIFICSMCIGGIIGLLFLLCFFVMLGNPIFVGNPIFEILLDFVSFVSIPLFYLLGSKLTITSMKLGIILFILYWAIVGMVIAFGLVWIYFFTFKVIGRIKGHVLNLNNLL